MDTTSTPTSAGPAGRCGAPVTTGRCPAPASGPADPTGLQDTYDRDRWLAAVLASELPRDARHLAHLLAHHAGPSGRLPAGGSHQEAPRLATQTRIDARHLRRMLNELEGRGWIRRPDIHTWQPRELLRPITLTLPGRGVGQEPPHTGGADA